MKAKLTEKQKKALLIAGITAAVYISLKYILRLVVPFLLAYWVALLVYPAARRLERRTRVKKGLWASVLVALLSAVFLVTLYFLGKLFFTQLFQAAGQLPAYLESMDGWMNDICCKCDDFLGVSRGTSMDFLSVQGENMMGTIQEQAGVFVMGNSMTALKWIIEIGAVFAIVSIGSVLIVSSMDRITRYRNISSFRQEIFAITSCLSRVGRAFFKSQLLIMALTSVVCGTGLYLLGNPYAVLLGVLIGLLDALPVFGTGTVLIPWALFSVFLGSWGYAIGLAAIYLLCYFLREALEAKLMGGHMGIPPLEMLMSMYIGLLLFGVTGFLLGPFGFMVIKELVEMYAGKGASAGI